VTSLLDPRSSLRLSHLRYFAGAVRSSADVTAYQRLFNLAGRSLEDLILSIYDTGKHSRTSTILGLTSPPSASSPMNMSSLVRLRNLSLTVVEFEGTSSPTWVLNLLCTISWCNEIEDLTITMYFSNLDDDAWVKIDQFLTGERFDCLKSVTLRCWRKRNQPWFQLPERRFASLASKKILTVYSEGDLVFPKKRLVV
jgi:hypothetical protein